MRRYQVARKKPVLKAITDALEHSGARILKAPSPSEAPFQYLIEAPDGERVSLVCYAFLANKYKQAGRPKDEHRFQLKYGSSFDEYHDIFIDPQRQVVTLMFGVHLDEGIFVAVDPSMHNPTWFSRSVEFKSAHCIKARRSGWVGWERERSTVRRKVEMPNLNSQTETILGFTPNHFLRYVFFERLATGMDTGERLFLLERLGEDDRLRPTEHPLEKIYGLSSREILDVIWGASRLNVAVRGSVAEHHLEKHLKAVSSIRNVTSIDADSRPDFEVTFKKKPYLIECKNVLRKSKRTCPKVDFQKTRASKSDPCSRYYPRNAFHVLAACLHPVTEKWEFRFRCTGTLDPHPTCIGKLSHKVFVTGEKWTEDVVEAIENAILVN